MARRGGLSCVADAPPAMASAPRARRSAGASGFGNDRQQVGDADVHPGLEQQGARLASMTGLVIEEVQDEVPEVPREGPAGHVLVRQRGLQLLGGERAGPALDELVELATAITEGRQ